MWNAEGIMRPWWTGHFEDAWLLFKRAAYASNHTETGSALDATNEQISLGHAVLFVAHSQSG